MAKTDKEDNINSLCKKYFTPELCDEHVTESKHTLRNKLWEQLYKYGLVVFNKKFTISDEVTKEQICYNVIEDAIVKCFEKFSEEPKDNYKAYYATIIEDFGKRAKKTRKESSLQGPIKKDEDGILQDTIEDSKTFTPEESYITTENGQRLLKYINKIFRSRERDDWWKSLVTCLFHDILQDFPKESLNRFIFFDENCLFWLIM